MLGFQALHQVIHPMHMKTSIRGLLIQQAKPVSPKEPVFTRSSLIKWVSCLPKSIQKTSKDLSFVNSNYITTRMWPPIEVHVGWSSFWLRSLDGLSSELILGPPLCKIIEVRDSDSRFWIPCLRLVYARFQDLSLGWVSKCVWLVFFVKGGWEVWLCDKLDKSLLNLGFACG